MSVNSKDFFREIGGYYDSKRKDLNLLLGAKDKIVHHHSGICPPESTFPEMSEEELLVELHHQENELTLRGIQYLGEIRPEMRGLDAGCGRGGSSFMLHQKFRCEIAGITLSLHQAEFASGIAKKFGVEDQVRFYQANMLETPFGSGSFDFIWACESTEHAPDLAQMLNEFSRIAKDGGNLVIITGCGNPNHPEGPRYIKAINDWYHIRIHAPSEYIELANQHGWELFDDVNLTPETIPYWDLRANSQHKTGVEELRSGYKSGALEYHLFSYRKSS